MATTMTIRLLISLTLAAVTLQATPCQAQSAGGDKDALLQEVRLLRQAIETLVGTNARVQIVFGRLQLQEQRTATTARRLEDVRGALANVVGQIAQLTESLQRYEELDLATLDPKQREQIPMEVRSRKSELQLLEAERYDSQHRRPMPRINWHWIKTPGVI